MLGSLTLQHPSDLGGHSLAVSEGPQTQPTPGCQPAGLLFLEDVERAVSPEARPGQMISELSPDRHQQKAWCPSRLSGSEQGRQVSSH